MEIANTEAICTNWDFVDKNEDKVEVFEKLTVSITLPMYFLVLLK